MVLGLLILIAGFTLFMGTLVAVGAVMPTARETGQIFVVVVTLLVVRLAVRLFRYGSMEYSKRVSVRAIFSQFRLRPRGSRQN